MHTDMERQFTLYEISTPYGRNYIGITSQPLPERLRQHLQRAKTAPSEHPFYADIRRCDGEGVTIRAIAEVGDIYKARDAEKKEIKARRGENLYNLSDGGELDAGTGGRVFYERLNADPSKREAYLEKLSKTKKDADWTDYDDLQKKAEQWRKEHPREAYKQSQRAIRIARRMRADTSSDDETLPETVEQRKRRLQYKYNRSQVASNNASEQWNRRTEEERAAVAQKISETAKQRNSRLTLEQRKAMTEKARAARLAKYGHGGRGE